MILVLVLTSCPLQNCLVDFSSFLFILTKSLFALLDNIGRQNSSRIFDVYNGNENLVTLIINYSHRLIEIHVLCALPTSNNGVAQKALRQNVVNEFAL